MRKQKYLIEIRKRRNELFTQFIENQGYSLAEFALFFGKGELTRLEKEYKKSVLNLQNRTRGLLGELFGEVYLTSQKGAEINNVVKDSTVFETPYGKRRVDVFWQREKLALEAKMGYVCFSRTIRQQIKKDKYLIVNDVFSKAIWFLFQGGSEKLKQELKMAGIEFIEYWKAELPKEHLKSVTIPLSCFVSR